MTERTNLGKAHSIRAPWASLMDVAKRETEQLQRDAKHLQRHRTATKRHKTSTNKCSYRRVSSGAVAAVL